MSQVAKWIFPAAGGKDGIVGTIKATVGFLTGNVGLIAAGVAQVAGVGKAKAQDRQASVTTLSVGEGPREMVGGLCVTGGSLVDVFNHGGQYGTDSVTRCIALADHAVDAIVGYYVDDQYYAWAGEGPQAAFSGKLSLYFRNAVAGGVAPPAFVTSAGAGWGATDRLDGLTHIWVRTDIDDKVWTRGHPQLRFLLRGLRVYDPRFDPALGYAGGSPQTWENRASHVFSTNAALLRYAFTRGVYAEGHQGEPEHLLIGRGLTADEAPPARIIAAANLCDEVVDGKPRYAASGVIRASDDFISVEEWFASAMAGVIVQREGGVEIEPGQAKAVVKTITDADLVTGEPVTFSKFLPDGSEGRVNTVVPSYIEPLQGWKDHAGPVRRSIPDIQADGGPRELALSLPLVTDGAQSDRNAEIARLISRHERRSSVCLPPDFAELEEGDWIAWTSARYHGGATVKYRIEGWRLDAKWRMRLALREIASSVYGVADPETGASDPEPPHPVINALSLSGVVATAVSLPGDGSNLPAIKLQWAAPDAAVTAIQAEVRAVGGGEIAPTRTNDVAALSMIVTNGVASTASLEARLVPITDPGRPAQPSAWISVLTDSLVADDTANVGGVASDMFVTRMIDVESLAATAAAGVSDLEEVYGDTASAAASASAAALSEANTVTLAAEAEGSASAASMAATGAVASETAAGSHAAAASASATNAATSAGAASTSAASASGSATTAAGHAATAATSATNAATSATAAGGSATAASGSASSAATSATNAANSASAASASQVSAASSYAAAREAAASLRPERMVDGGFPFLEGSHIATGALEPADIATLAGFGEVRLLNTASTLHVWRAPLPASAGTIYEITAEVYLHTKGAGSPVLRGFSYSYGDDTEGSTLGSQGGPSVSLATAGQTYTLTQRLAASAPAGGWPWTAGAVWVRAGVFIQGHDASTIVYVKRMAVRDVTALAASEQQATASATSASSAATSASAAGTSATASSGSATTASTQAGLALTYAGQSSTSAGDAAASAITAGTAATTATSAAATASTHASNASSSAASASASATIAASVGLGSMNRNPMFTDWPVQTGETPPTGWAEYSGASGTLSRVAGINGSPNAIRTAASSSAAYGIQSASPYALSAPGGEYTVVEADISLVSGSLVGSGVFLLCLDAGGITVKSTYKDFAVLADATGVVRGAGVAGSIYRYRFLIDARFAGTNRYFLYGMARHSNFSAAAAATLDWHRLNVRAATPEEIAAGVGLPALSASVAATQSVVADLETAYSAARLTFSATTGGGAAIFTLFSDTYGAVAGLAADQIYFGANTFFDDATDTLRTTIGSNYRVIALGAPFGTTGDIETWYGPASVAYASISKTNGLKVEDTAGRIWLNGRRQNRTYTEIVTAASVNVSSGTMTDVLTLTSAQAVSLVDTFHVAASMSIQTSPSRTRSSSTTTAPSGLWEIWELPASGAIGERKVANGSWSTTIAGGGGNPEYITDLNMGYPGDTWSDISREWRFKHGGAERFVLRMSRSGAENLLAATFSIQLNVVGYD